MRRPMVNQPPIRTKVNRIQTRGSIAANPECTITIVYRPRDSNTSFAILAAVIDPGQPEYNARWAITPAISCFVTSESDQGRAAHQASHKQPGPNIDPRSLRQSLIRRLADVVAAGDAALCLASVDRFARLSLLMGGQLRLAAELHTLDFGVGTAARCAFDDGGSSDGCRDQRSTHGQALAVRSAGPVTSGQGLRRRGLSVGRRPAGLCRGAPSGGDRVSPRQTCDQPVRIRIQRKLGHTTKAGFLSWLQHRPLADGRAVVHCRL